VDPFRPIAARLDKIGQSHLLRWWPELDPPQKHALLVELQSLDLERLAPLIGSVATSHGAPESAGDRAARALPPENMVRLPDRGGDPAEWLRAQELGDWLLRGHKVGAILVAGGQGTRLGFDHPKGMFKIGPVSGKPLFQLLCEQLAARGRQAGTSIPYYIMTSKATHEETRAFFQEHHYFGLDPDDVSFFQQASLPAVDDDGRILLDQKYRLTASPDGHGGLLHALKRAGLLGVMADRGIEYLYYHQVDNPAAIVCDPAFLGLHVLRDSEMSTKVVAKTSAAERMGVVVDLDGHTEIIEYSDLPAERAAARGPDGGLLLWAGSTAIHAFNRSFLERLAIDSGPLPYHRARKAIPHINDAGERVSPLQPNGWKFEQFIFDALPQASATLVVEADRPREFLPVKNHDGADSPATVQAGLLQLYREWLDEAGAIVAPQARVEISPLVATDAAELAKKIKSGTRFDSDTCIE
jgi:UDP-N-acetylglucosamine/UDP-N-acetylgalactosamine diphosphorylase